MINRNMRCIEMTIQALCNTLLRMINRNMRCIEMLLCLMTLMNTTSINRNMRCIEMKNHLLLFALINRNMRCIEIHNPNSPTGFFAGCTRCNSFID